MLAPDDVLVVVADDNLTVRQVHELSEALHRHWLEDKIPGHLVVVPGYTVRELKVLRHKKRKTEVHALNS